MHTIEDVDKEQEALDNKAEWLRSQIPPVGQEGPDAKPLKPIEKLKIEKELDEEQHPHREPERPVTPFISSGGAEALPQAKTSQKKHIAIDTQTEDEAA